MNNYFSIIIPCRNCSKYIERCLFSCVTQKYPNDKFEILVTDDNSTDDTADKIKKVQAEHNDVNLMLFENYERKYALENVDNMIKFSPDGSVIVIVDGDDHLLSNNVLSLLDKVYQDENIWMSYGGMKSSDGSVYTWDLPHDQRYDFRNNVWGFSHLFAIRKKLYNEIPKDYFKDDNGNWLRYTYDKAAMICGFELCAGKFAYIDTPVYFYNMNSDDNVHKIDSTAQGKALEIIMQKKRLEPLESL